MRAASDPPGIKGLCDLVGKWETVCLNLLSFPQPPIPIKDMSALATAPFLQFACVLVLCASSPLSQSELPCLEAENTFQKAQPSSSLSFLSSPFAFSFPPTGLLCVLRDVCPSPTRRYPLGAPEGPGACCCFFEEAGRKVCSLSLKRSRRKPRPFGRRGSTWSLRGSVLLFSIVNVPTRRRAGSLALT